MPRFVYRDSLASHILHSRDQRQFELQKGIKEVGQKKKTPWHKPHKYGRSVTNRLIFRLNLSSIRSKQAIRKLLLLPRRRTILNSL